MGQGNEIGRIGRREGPPEPRHDPVGEPGLGGPLHVPEGNTGIAPPAVNEPAPPADGFVTDLGAMPSSPLLNGEGAPVLQSVNDLVPNLNHLNELGEIPIRFATDAALMRSQLLAPGLPTNEQIDRTFRFFLAYAERFVEIARPLEAKAELADQHDPNSHPEGQPGEKGKKGEKKAPPRVELPLPEAEPSPERGLFGSQPPPEGSAGQLRPGMFEVIEEQDEPPRAPAKLYSPEEVGAQVQVFARALEEAGFGQMRDLDSGKDGLALAQELLVAHSPEELEERAARLELHQELPPPTQDAQTPRERNQQAITRDLPLQPIRDLAAEAVRQGDVRRAIDPSGMRAAQPMIEGGFALAPAALQNREQESFDQRIERHGRTNKRLGGRMLWNVLHTFRQSGADSADADAKWDRVTFGAMLFLAGVVVAVIVLVSL